MSEINLEFLLGAMPAAEATLYRVLIQLIPAPIAEAPNLSGRQIEMVELAKLTGFSKRWVIELMQRLEKKSFIRTDGGRGAVKWIWLLPPGVLRLGKSYPTELAQRKKTSSGQTQDPRVATYQSKLRHKETAPSQKPAAEINITPLVEKPAEMPKRRQKASMPSIPPAVSPPDNPVVLATMVIPPPPTPGNPLVPAPMMTPATSTHPDGPAAGIPVAWRAAKIAPPLSAAPGDLTADIVVVPAAGVTPPPPLEPAAPTVPAKRIAPRKSTKKLPAGRSHWESAPIEELVAYACSLPVTPELIYSLKTPGMTGGLLLLALERLCQRIERYGLMPYTDRSSLVTALRTILSDL